MSDQPIAGDTRTTKEDGNMLQFKEGDSAFVISDTMVGLQGKSLMPSALHPVGVTKVTKTTTQVKDAEGKGFVFMNASGRLKKSPAVRLVTRKEANALQRKERKRMREQLIRTRFDFVIRSFLDRDPELSLKKQSTVIEMLKPYLTKDMLEELETLKAY